MSIQKRKHYIEVLEEARKHRRRQIQLFGKHNVVIGMSRDAFRRIQNELDDVIATGASADPLDASVGAFIDFRTSVLEDAGDVVRISCNDSLLK